MRCNEGKPAQQWIVRLSFKWNPEFSGLSFHFHPSTFHKLGPERFEMLSSRFTVAFHNEFAKTKILDAVGLARSQHFAPVWPYLLSRQIRNNEARTSANTWTRRKKRRLWPERCPQHAYRLGNCRRDLQESSHHQPVRPLWSSCGSKKVCGEETSDWSKSGVMWSQRTQWRSTYREMFWTDMWRRGILIEPLTHLHGSLELFFSLHCHDAFCKGHCASVVMSWSDAAQFCPVLITTWGTLWRPEARRASVRGRVFILSALAHLCCCLAWYLTLQDLYV